MLMKGKKNVNKRNYFIIVFTISAIVLRVDYMWEFSKEERLDYVSTANDRKFWYILFEDL